MLRQSALALLMFISVVGCGEPRFAEVSSGTYACEATVELNTCGSPLPDHSMSVLLDGGGTDIIDLRAPDQSALASAPNDPVWNPVQFGAQSEPFAYELTGAAACDFIADRTYQYSLRSDVVVGTDALTMNVNWRYMNAGACGYLGVTAGACQVGWRVECALVS